jgi:hypothetical protein
MAREVYDDRLVFLKRRSAPSFPLQCFVDDSLKAYRLLLISLSATRLQKVTYPTSFR